MPRSIPQDETLEWLRKEVAREQCANSVAKRLKLERTLVWRVAVGKGASASNLRLIRSRMVGVSANLAASPAAAQEPNLQQPNVADVRKLLHYLLQAVDALESSQSKAPGESS